MRKTVLVQMKLKLDSRVSDNKYKFTLNGEERYATHNVVLFHANSKEEACKMLNEDEVLEFKIQTLDFK